MLGTNGGGFFNANASHPFENPTPLSNFIQILSIFAIPRRSTYYLGRMVKNPGPRLDGLGGDVRDVHRRCAGLLAGRGVGQSALARSSASIPPPETWKARKSRFGIFNSALFATITTDASCGAVNSMHDSFTPLGGLVPLFNIQTGEVIFGGVGAGMYGMLIFVILAIFIAGLMVGRTPEYLGKKIEALT